MLSLLFCTLVLSAAAAAAQNPDCSTVMPDLVVSPTGVFSGTPSSFGSCDINVKVCDTESPAQCTTKVLTLPITPGPVIIVTTSPLPAARQNQPYQVSFSATGGNGAYTWTKVPLQ